MEKKMNEYMEMVSECMEMMKKCSITMDEIWKAYSNLSEEESEKAYDKVCYLSLISEEFDSIVKWLENREEY